MQFYHGLFFVLVWYNIIVMVGKMCSAVAAHQEFPRFDPYVRRSGYFHSNSSLGFQTNPVILQLVEKTTNVPTKMAWWRRFSPHTHEHRYHAHESCWLSLITAWLVLSVGGKTQCPVVLIWPHTCFHQLFHLSKSPIRLRVKVLCGVSAL